MQGPTDTQQRIKLWLGKGYGTCDCRILAHRLCLIRMLIALWHRQTASEQMSHATRERNDKGFNAYDARRAGYFIENLRGGDLPKHMAWKAKFMLAKYSRQLAEIKDAS